MSTIIARNRFTTADETNYLIAGNLCNAFVLGNVASRDDFFLIGAQPPLSGISYPLLTGNILDSQGEVLFRLVQNVLTFNPMHCSKVLGNEWGYTVVDKYKHSIFEVRTAQRPLPESTEQCMVTTIRANFYDKQRNLVFEANSGEDNEEIETTAKCAFGYLPGGGFGLAYKYTDEEIKLASLAIQTHGAFHEVLTGDFVDQDIVLDGNAIMNASLTRCRIHIRSGKFAFIGNELDSCQYFFEGEAETVIQFAQLVTGQEP